MVIKERKKLGELLVAVGLVTEKQLQEALKVQKETGEKVGQILVKQGIITEEDLITYLSEQMGVPYMDLSDYLISPEIINMVPEALARRHQLIPIFKVGDILTIAMVDPLNIFAIDEVSVKAGCSVEPALGTETEIKKAIDQYYGVKGSINDVVKSIEDKKLIIEGDKEIETKRLADMAEEAPVIKLVNLVIMQAVRDGASDIHIEPEEKTLRTRVRIDGILHEVTSPPKHLHAAIVSRVKILSDLDIAERRTPQDGKFRIKVENRDIDIRVSTYPTIYGENVVMRLLDTSSVLFGLEQLGFSTENLAQFNEVIRRPFGIILVTGPTGSGKTTTLYASLNTINSVDKNIVTIEDPVEYSLKLIRQSQINPKANLTFASGLRSIIRQDPDIIMVGEIRDLETAEIAIHAALTGHLVFSTLHTNDAPGAITRLIDMGVEPFLVSSSVIAVIAQRLIRTICPDCKESYQPTPEMIDKLGLTQGEGEIVLYRGKGCKKCMNTGYKGRIAIIELMEVDEKIRDLTVAKKASSDELRKAACEAGMKVLRQDGLKKVVEGITTPEEVMRVTQEM